MKEIQKSNKILKLLLIVLAVGVSLYYITIVKGKEYVNVTIQGDVSSPGVFKVVKNSTLADVIGKAKPTPTSDLVKLDLSEAITQAKTITVLTQDTANIQTLGNISVQQYIIIKKSIIIKT